MASSSVVEFMVNLVKQKSGIEMLLFKPWFWSGWWPNHGCSHVFENSSEASEKQIMGWHTPLHKNQWAPRISFDYEEIWSQWERSKLQLKQQGRKLRWKWNAELSRDHHYLSSSPCLSVRLTHFSHWLAPQAVHHHHAALNDVAYEEENKSIPADCTWYSFNGQRRLFKGSYFPVNTWSKETSSVI